MAQTIEERLKEYQKDFNKLVVRSSNRLCVKECEDLFHIYKDTTLLPASLRTGALGEIQAIKLLARLEQAREFSYAHPEKLVGVFEALDREDLCEEVGKFVQKHEEMLAVAKIRFSPLPNSGTTYAGNPCGQASSQTDLQTDLDGPYPLRKQNKDDFEQVIQVDTYCSFYPAPLNQLTMENSTAQQMAPSQDVAHPQQSRQLPSLPGTPKTNKAKMSSKSKKETENTENPYTYVKLNPRLLHFQPDLPRVSPTSSDYSPPSSIEFNTSRGTGVFSSLGSQSESSEPGDSSSGNDSNDEPIYEYPDMCLSNNTLQLIRPSEPPPLVEEKMRLLVKPIRDMIESSQHRIVTSKPIYAQHHSCSNVTFELRITTGAVITGPSTQAQINNSGVEVKVSTHTSTNKYVSADLYIQPGSKGLQNTLLLQAHLGIKQPRVRPSSKHKKSGIAQSELTKPRDKLKKPVQYLHEQRVLLDLPLSLCPAESKKRQQPNLQHVASFPNLMSHRNFMNDKLIVTPFLELKLFIIEFKI